MYFCFCYTCCFFFSFAFFHISLAQSCSMSHTNVLYHFVAFCVKMDHKLGEGWKQLPLWFCNLSECFIRET